MRRNQMTIRDAERGELAVRNLCDRAWEIYGTTDPFDVFLTEDGEYYVYEGSSTLWGPVTFEQLEKALLAFGEDDD